MKYVVVLIDGMADEVREDLDGKTPLEYATLPTINEMAKRSELGMVKTVPEGMPPGSDVANLSVIGYDPKKYHTGRSPLEAASVGVDLLDTDVTYRCNLVTVSDDKEFNDRVMLDHSAGDISSKEAEALIKALKESLDTDVATLYKGVSYRNLMVWKDGSTDVNLVPPHDFLEKTVGAHLPSGDHADIILDMTKRSYEILKDHPINKKRIEAGKNPANSVWIWGEGKKPLLDNFQEKYGVKGTVISAVDLIKGIGLSSGLGSIDVEGATGTLETNFDGKAQATVEAIKAGYDYVYVHLEAPDECSHQGDLKGKLEAIEIIDEKIVKFIKNKLDDMAVDYKMMILPDHPTPVSTRTHTSNPVPYMIYESSKADKKPSDEVYCEKNCEATGNYFSDGYKLAEYFLNQK